LVEEQKERCLEEADGAEENKEKRIM